MMGKLHDCKRGLDTATPSDYNRWWRERTTDHARIEKLETVEIAHAGAIIQLTEENQRLKDALVKANNNQMAAAQCASDFKYGYEKRGKEIEKLETLLKQLRTITDKQAKDEGLWFVATTAPEAYLQQELRKLHSAIETAPVPDEEQRVCLWQKQAIGSWDEYDSWGTSCGEDYAIIEEWHEQLPNYCNNCGGKVRLREKE